MSQSVSRSGLLGALMVAMGLALVPGCAGTATRQPTPQIVQPEGSRNIVYRPIISNFMRPKSFYLSGYAGNSYPPLGSGRVTEPVIEVPN